MTYLKHSILYILFLVSSLVQSQQACLLDEQPVKALVIDQIELLSETQHSTLESKLIEFDNRSSTQILVVITDNLCGLDYAAYTYRLGEKYSVGDKKFNNGIVLMVKPTGGQGERHTFIATGYGLEGVIPDATAKMIVDNELIPNFKQEKYYEGLDKGTSVLMGLALKEFSAKEYKAKNKGPSPALSGILVLFVIGIIIFTRIRTVRRYAIGHDIPFWTAMMLMSNHRHRSGGGWSNFSSGSGNFGGFGGFGGGSFGGGGAGGSW